MPLFKKRGSQKNKDSKIQSKEANSKSAAEPDCVPSTQSEVSVEVSDLLQDLITKTVNMDISSNETVTPGSIEIDKNHESICESDSFGSSDGERISQQDTNAKLPKHKRSVSGSHFEISSRVQPKGQRKFGSDGNVLAMAEKLIPHKQRKELDEVIGKYVDKLIWNSIENAVKNVDVNNLYQEIFKDFSNRSSSESADSVEEFIVEQRLSSHSISELVELDSGHESKRDVSTSQELHDKLNEPECTPKECEDVDHESFVGYLADYEDTTSADDLKSYDEDSSVCSMSDGLQNQGNIDIDRFSKQSCENSLKREDDISQICGDGVKGNDIPCLENNYSTDVSAPSEVLNEQSVDIQSNCQQGSITSLGNISGEEDQNLPPKHSSEKQVKENSEKLCSAESFREQEKNVPVEKNCSEQEPKSPSIVENSKLEQESHSAEEENQKPEKLSLDQETSPSDCINDLIVMSPSDDYLMTNNTKYSENDIPPPDIDETLPQHETPVDEERKVNWKVDYLHVKLPQKSRGKTHLKAWKKRRVAIQPDEFVNDPQNPSLVVSVYGADSRKHKSTFWQTVSSQRAVVYRSSSSTHRYAFTISDEGRAIIHLSADSESATQEWMAAIRAVLWPPSPFMQLEKMMSGREFEISLIDNEFSYHAGLLGMYGYLTITPRKLILLHPQQGYVIQEWYLNTVDKFHLVPQPKAEDAHKVLAMTTCSDSSTGRGEMLLYCNEAVNLLQSLASTIHQVLSLRSKEDGGGKRYQKELEEMAEWLLAPPQDSLNMDAKSEEHYQVPKRQVKSLLDIPNFIFEKSLSPVASAIYPAPTGNILEPLEASRAKPTTTSQDSGISTCHSGDDFLNSSITSFVVGGGPMTGKSSDSEMSDTYTPPRSPETVKKIQSKQKLEEHLSASKA